MAAPKRHEAMEQLLALVFEGRWSHAEMAARVGVSTRTIDRWVMEEDFRARLDEMRADLAATLRSVAYADKAQRIIGLSQMAESARREYEARPLLIETHPTRDGEATSESFNRDAHAAFREALADIAAELGARKNVTELGGTIEVSERITFYLPTPEAPPPDEAPEDGSAHEATHERA